MSDLVQREVQLPASTSEVWAALTDPAWLAAWFADEAELDLRPGGEARFVTGDEVRTGWVEEITPPEGDGGAGRLAFWWSAGDEPASRVEFSLWPTDDGACLRVVETRPLQVLELVGTPLSGWGGRTYGPALVAA